MDNVVILDSCEVVTDYMFNWTAFWFVALAMFIVFTIVYICTISDVEVLPWTFALIGMRLFSTIVLGGLFGAVLFPTPSEYATEYKVYIDGDIDMTELIEKYDIIDQEGLIFKVREK